MAVHTSVAPRKLKEKPTCAIKPRLRLRTIDLKTTAIRTRRLQPNSTHNNNTLATSSQCYSQLGRFVALRFLPDDVAGISGQPDDWHEVDSES